MSKINDWITSISTFVLAIATIVLATYTVRLFLINTELVESTKDYVNATKSMATLNKEYVKETRDLVKTTIEQTNFMRQQWEYEHSPHIVADYSVRFGGPGVENPSLKIYLENIGKGACEILQYKLSVFDKSGSIENFYSGQKYTIWHGYITKLLEKLKNGFEVDLKYAFANSTKTKNYKFKVNLLKPSERDMSDIYNILEKLHKDFAYMYPESKYNISGKLHNINESLEKIEKKTK
ncbi:MAG: hypothetical protein JW983_00680 [Elusimicrobia bacterium]|nr:hypothetical protein [Elusimicrobiota bacterium]